MKRVKIQARPDWKEKVEKLGLLFHTTEDKPYWNEEAYYEFSERQILEIEKATNELHEMCLKAVDFVIDNDRFQQLAIPTWAVPAIKMSWDREPPSIYGRFDLAYDGIHPPKMLEYNADTPTSLLEAAVIQWHWLEEVFPDEDQFNSIWEGLVEKWTELKDGRYIQGTIIHFASDANVEDMMTVTVLRDTAEEAGLPTAALTMEEIGWHADKKWFVDMDSFRIQTLFKLYPWEWLVHEEFGTKALQIYHEMQWIEPIWKMVLSNKGILAILWEMFPNHPYLLPTFFDGPRHLTQHVKKPLLSREGANITVASGSDSVSTSGAYGEEGFVYQEYFPLPNFDGNRPVIGSWVVTDFGARGIGVREADGPITDNWSRFVPHLFR